MDSYNLKSKVPKEVLECHNTLKKAGFEAYLVGGCVRDLLIDRVPSDWDITTSATPEEIVSLFPHTYYENDFGTVGVVFDGVKQVLNDLGGGEMGCSDFIVEVTPFRTEGAYTDGRHPDNVCFSKNIHDDLKRRDFTINAIAFDPVDNLIIDDFGGIKDIHNKLIKTVGDANLRFNEDGLRLLRAVRFAAQLSFTIDSKTMVALTDNANVLDKIASERIRDEFVKICQSKDGGMAIFMLVKLDLVRFIIPELSETLHVKQNQAHSFEVFEHLVRSFQHAIDKDYPLDVRIAALLHDIGKPRSRAFSEEKQDYTFYGHEVIGAKMTKKILERLKFSRETIEKVTKLVRWHMFFSDVDQITPSAVRRMISNVGKDMIWDLVNLRICDRVGTGRPKEDPYRLRKYISMIEEVLRDPVTVGMLKIDGNDIISKLNVTPGPRIGFMLNILLEEVLNDPGLNTEEHLVSRVTELDKSDDLTLRKLSENAVSVRNAIEEGEVLKIRQKNRVK